MLLLQRLTQQGGTGGILFLKTDQLRLIAPTHPILYLVQVQLQVLYYSCMLPHQPMVAYVTPQGYQLPLSSTMMLSPSGGKQNHISSSSGIMDAVDCGQCALFSIS